MSQWKKGMENKCLTCSRSKCCESICLPLLWKGVDADTKRWIKYHGLSLKKVRGELYVDIDRKCSKLIDGKCSIYKKRPNVCREYDCKDNQEFL